MSTGPPQRGPVDLVDAGGLSASSATPSPGRRPWSTSHRASRAEPLLQFAVADRRPGPRHDHGRVVGMGRRARSGKHADMSTGYCGVVGTTHLTGRAGRQTAWTSPARLHWSPAGPRASGWPPRGTARGRRERRDPRPAGVGGESRSPRNSATACGSPRPTSAARPRSPRRSTSPRARRLRVASTARAPATRSGPSASRVRSRSDEFTRIIEINLIGTFNVHPPGGRAHAAARPVGERARRHHQHRVGRPRSTGRSVRRRTRRRRAASSA